MVLAHIRLTNDHEGDRRAADRILRGISGLAEKGYIVEEYNRWVGGEIPKYPNERRQYLLAVIRTDEADDAEHEAWLNSLFDKGTLKSDKEKPPLFNG